MSSIRVLHYFAFPGGGIGRYVHELLSEMAKSTSVTCELACIPSYEYRDRASYRVWPGLFDITHPVPLIRRMRFAANLMINPLRMIRRASQAEAQIIHLSTIPHVTFSIWGPRLRRAGLHLVATAHDVRRHHALFHLGNELKQLRNLYRSCAALFVHSNHQKEDLIAFAGVDPQRVVIVPHGPYYYGPPSADRDTLRKRYGIPDGKQVALFFGDIRPDKNLDLLLHAVAPYKDRLFLVVAGRAKQGTAIQQLQNRAAELGLQNGVHVLWMNYYIPYEEVPNLFSLADWLALPYSRSFTSQSGVLNIAVAYKLPILASALPTFCEVFSQSSIGITVPPDDLAALRAAVGQMLNPRTLASFQGFDKAASLFSWEKNLAVTTSVYQTLGPKSSHVVQQPVSRTPTIPQ